MSTKAATILCIGLTAASCSKSSSSTSPAPASPASSGGGGGSGSYTGATGSVSLTVKNLAGSGMGLVDGELGLTNVPTVGESISLTPTSYLISFKDIFIENSLKTNTVASSTGSGSSTSTSSGSGTTSSGMASGSTTTSLALASGTSTGTGAPVTLGYSGIVDPNMAYVYKCSETTESGCAIDLANDAAMAAAFTGTPDVPVGTFDTIGYDVICDESLDQGSSGGFHVGVGGTVTIGGTVYYTTSNSGVLSTSEADLSPAIVPIYGGCYQTTMKLPTPITVTANEKVTVSLYLSAQNIAWAGTDGSYNPGGCVNSGDNYVCTNLPAFVPTAGGFTPTFQLYDITVSPGSSPTGGQVAILLDNDTAIGAFLMRYYTPTMLSNSALWDAGVVSFKKNSDGTYNISSSTDPNAAGPRCEFPNFELLPSTTSAAATGTVTNAGSALSYSATRIQ